MDGPEVPAHRVVLAASSGFFRALFSGAGAHMSEGRVESNSVVQLPGVTYKGLGVCIDAIYGSPLKVRE